MPVPIAVALILVGGTVVAASGAVLEPLLTTGPRASRHVGGVRTTHLDAEVAAGHSRLPG